MTRPAAEIRARIYKQIDVRGPDECWPWLGKLNPDGYAVGGARIDGRCISQTYRVVFWLEQGYLPSRSDDPPRSIDHLCRNRACVNPAHLEGVPHRVNVLRGDTVPAAHAKVTHCPKGHEYTTENTYWRPDRPRQRMCKACGRDQSRAFYARYPGLRHGETVAMYRARMANNQQRSGGSDG